MGRAFVSNFLLLSQILINLPGGLGWVEGCLFPFWNCSAHEKYYECEQPGGRKKVETTILCRNLLNNKCYLTTIIHHKERKDQDMYVSGCVRNTQWAVTGEEYYILEHLETTLICKNPPLLKHASHQSVTNKHTGRDLTC